MPEALVMYRFRYRDPCTGHWMRARYRATLADIRARYVEWTLEVDVEHRRVDIAAIGALAQPPAKGWPGGDEPGVIARRHAADPSVREGQGKPFLEQAPALDVLEAALLACFLRRYVTYCARRGRYAAMNGAARLLRDIARTGS